MMQKMGGYGTKTRKKLGGIRVKGIRRGGEMGEA